MDFGMNTAKVMVHGQYITIYVNEINNENQFNTNTLFKGIGLYG